MNAANAIAVSVAKNELPERAMLKMTVSKAHVIAAPKPYLMISSFSSSELLPHTFESVAQNQYFGKTVTTPCEL